VEVGKPVNLADSGAISNCAGTILGFYVNSTSSGVILIKDGGSGGTALDAAITPAIGFHRFPARIGSSSGGYMTLSSGAINATFFFVPDANVI
jgi:hypothetical protein